MEIKYVKHLKGREKRGLISHWKLENFIYQFREKELAEYFVEVFEDEGKAHLLEEQNMCGFVRVTSIVCDKDTPMPPLIDGRFEGTCMATILVGENISNKFEANQAAHEAIKKIEEDLDFCR